MMRLRYPAKPLPEIRRFAERLRSEAGESLPEVMVGMLIACVATVALVTMTLSASSSSGKTRIASEDMWNQEAAIARSTPSVPGQSGDITASVSAGSVSISAGSVTETLDANIYSTSNFTYFEIAQASKAEGAQGTGGSSAGGGEGGGA